MARSEKEGKIRNLRDSLTLPETVAWRVKKNWFYAGLSIALVGVACNRTPSSNQSGEDQLEEKRPPNSITAQVAESLARSGPAEPVAALVPKKDSIQKKARALPPPKEEPWMDTLTDLTGITPPNAASLISEDPMPLNKSSVELLIASQFNNRKPETLVLRVYVSEEGRVLRYQLLKSSNPRLGPAYFVRPLLELRFSPARQGQRPVAAWTTLYLQIPSAS